MLRYTFLLMPLLLFAVPAHSQSVDTSFFKGLRYRLTTIGADPSNADVVDGLRRPSSGSRPSPRMNFIDSQHHPGVIFVGATLRGRPNVSPE